MTKLSGVIKKSYLEGGHWLLVTADGDQYQLQGGDTKGLAAGARVTVEGTVDKQAFGIGMTGPIFKVSKLTRTAARK
jgi:hypothetical protein